MILDRSDSEMSDETVVQLTNSPFLHYIIDSINFYPEHTYTHTHTHTHTYTY